MPASFGKRTAGPPGRTLAEALGQAGVGSVRILAYVDYDPAGWIIGRAVAKQLELFGLAAPRVDFLIRQDCFTPRENASTPTAAPRAAPTNPP